MRLLRLPGVTALPVSLVVVLAPCAGLVGAQDTLPLQVAAMLLEKVLIPLKRFSSGEHFSTLRAGDGNSL